MNLQQEYYLRNRVSAPFVYHGNGQMLLLNPVMKRASERYKLVQVKSVNREQVGSDGAFIGRFDISYSSPVKNSSSLFGIVEEETVYWSDFQYFILDLVSELKDENWFLLTDAKFKRVCCWEILSFSQDDRFSNMPLQLLNLNYSVFNDRISIEEKCIIVDAIVDHIHTHSEVNSPNHHVYKTIMGMWALLMDIAASPNYSYWLSALMGEK